MEETGRSGFTLVELLVTLSVAALLAGVAVPAASRFIDSSRLRAAAEQLVQDLRQARNLALVLQRDVYVSFAAPAGGDWCYGWRDRQPCNCRLRSSQDGACRVDGAVHRHHSDEFPRVRLQPPHPAAGHQVRFSAVRGTASAGTFRVANRSGELRVIVSPLGRVRACAVSGQGYAPC